MQETEDSRTRAAREAELSEVLSSYVEPRAVSYTFVVSFVVVGLLLCVSVAWAASSRPRAPAFRIQEAAPESFERGVEAYRRNEWDEALQQMRQARAQASKPDPRVDDYIERLELIRVDGERLARAEEALAADHPARALALAGLIAPNSPLFPQAELLERTARAQVQREQRVADAKEQPDVSRAPAPTSVAKPNAPVSPRKRPARVVDPKPLKANFEGEW